MRTFLTGLVIAGMFADPVCQAAQRDVGPRACRTPVQEKEVSTLLTGTP